MGKPRALENLGIDVYEASPRFRSIDKHVAVHEADGSLVAVTGVAGDRDAKSIARLFAAAPELLAAVHLVLALHEQRDAVGPAGAVPGFRVHLDPNAETQLRAAIAKAEGRS